MKNAFDVFLHTVVSISLLVVSVPASAQVPDDSPRSSPLVKLIRQIDGTVISLFIEGNRPNQFSGGSGTIIHPAGYVLTNNHVLIKGQGLAVLNDKPVKFVVVGRLPEKDIALVRLLGIKTELPTLPLGHSHDVMNGESVVVAGNPGLRGIVFTSGIVSSKRILLDAPNELIMTFFRNSRRDNFIQFDAASNRGNSGGPLVNMEGEMIGVVSALIPQEQNSGFAIPVDRVRRLIDQTLEPELIYSRSVGIEVNPLADAVLVTEVAEGSAAAKGGILVGDTIRSINDEPLRHAVDWTLNLHRLLPRNQALRLVVQRNDQELPIEVNPPVTGPAEPVELSEEAEEGLAFDFYHGKWNRMPNFDELEPVRSGVMKEVGISEFTENRKEHYAVRARGWIRIPKEDLYRMTIVSDDGSRVFFHDQLLIDHDGDHPPTPASRLLRAKAGLHPIRIEHFQGAGDHSLEIKLESINATKSEKLPIEIFHVPVHADAS